MTRQLKIIEDMLHNNGDKPRPIYCAIKQCACVTNCCFFYFEEERKDKSDVVTMYVKCKMIPGDNKTIGQLFEINTER